MLSLELSTPREVGDLLRDRFRQRRLALNLSQTGLAERSGVNVHSLRRYERTGLIALESLLKLALVLGILDDFARVAADTAAVETRSLDDILKANRTRTRGRRS
jgi:transcriptional regulator with XRE-family HTH domain